MRMRVLDRVGGVIGVGALVLKGLGVDQERLGVMKPSPVVRSTLSRDDPPAFYGAVLLLQLDSHE
jgi:hypothetical protein